MKVVKISHSVDDLKMADVNVNSSMILAVCKGNLEEVRQLINSYGLSYSSEWSDGYVLLCDALKFRQAAVTRLLVTNGSRVNGPGDTPLHLALENDDIDNFEMLLDKGAEVNAKDRYGMTPLHYAVGEECVFRNPYFLPTSFDGTYTQFDEYPPERKSYLIESQARAAMYHDPAVNKKMITLLLNMGADVNAKILGGLPPSHQLKSTPLYFAVSKGLKENVKTLLEYGAQVEFESTILFLGAKEGHHDIVETLLEFGADINPIDEYGETALSCVARKLSYLTEKLEDPDYLESEDDEPEWRKFHDTAAVLECHIFKMNIAELYVSEKNIASVTNIYIISSHIQDQCREEIAIMNSEKIGNTNISFYNILSKDTSSLAAYLRNEKIVEVLESGEYKTRFPMYATLITSHVRKATRRKELLEQGNEVVYFLFNKFTKLEKKANIYGVIKQILSYLNNEDLYILIYVCKPFVT